MMFQDKTHPPNLLNYTEYPAAVVGQLQMQGVLGAVTLGQEWQSGANINNINAAPFPAPLGVRGYPLGSWGTDKPYLEGKRDNLDFTNIEVKPSSTLLQILERRK